MIAYRIKISDFIISDHPQPQVLGYLLFSASIWHLADRDQRIGWDKKDREKRLNLIINNNRFLIFPWGNVPNLASKALALVTSQIREIGRLRTNIVRY